MASPGLCKILSVQDPGEAIAAFAVERAGPAGVSSTLRANRGTQHVGVIDSRMI